MKIVRVRKKGWNTYAALGGPFWYIAMGMYGKGLVMLLIAAVTIGVGIIPIWLYCGFRGNRDFYYHLKNKNVNIY